MDIDFSSSFCIVLLEIFFFYLKKLFEKAEMYLKEIINWYNINNQRLSETLQYVCWAQNRKSCLFPTLEKKDIVSPKVKHSWRKFLSPHKKITDTTKQSWGAFTFWKHRFCCPGNQSHKDTSRQQVTTETHPKLSIEHEEAPAVKYTSVWAFALIMGKMDGGRHSYNWAFTQTETYCFHECHAARSDPSPESTQLCLKSPDAHTNSRLLRSTLIFCHSVKE